jgi:heptosyltransferase-2
MSTLVIRLSSLGDLVLTGAVTEALHPVCFLTSRRYVEIAAALPGVDEVLAWEDRPPLRGRGFERVIDLHASPRSRWLTRGMGASRVRRCDLRRRLRVALKTTPAPGVVERYAEAAGVAAAPIPWLSTAGPHDCLVLLPGAAHSTKRWSPDRFSEIGRRWQAEGGQVIVLGSRSESELCEDVGAGHAEVICEDGFSGALRAMGRAERALGLDSGLTHLAAACGVPTLTLFGPTHREDGFWDARTQACSIELSCRPCSRFGGDVCPMGDHMCMQELSTDRVWSALSQVLTP